MPQTFYIENDEEIISIISHLRKSSSQENFFVFPKHALVLQSIVNLRLFQREADKLGKKIIIVTQDDAGKKLAEKAGVETESYLEDFSQRPPHLELTAAQGGKEVAAAAVVPPQESEMLLRSQDIGSTDFYTPGGNKPLAITSTPVLSLQNEPQALRIRNASPPQQTSLNSRRFMGDVPPQKPPLATAPQPLVPSSTNQMPVKQASVQDNRDERLKNFFTNKREGDRTSISAKKASPQPEQRSPKIPTSPKKIGTILSFLGGVSLLSLIGVGLFLFLPKAEIHITPHRIALNTDLQFDGRPEGSSAWDEKSIPVRIIEKTEPVALSVTATGTAPGSAQKARGAIIVSNQYSADAQSLVATTRFESADGKIFRLIDGVTVPGMKSGQPGVVEVSVIAEETGTNYNIAATSFTIPGFKGGPKYTQFSGKSTKAMSGGSDASGSGMSVISKTDLEKAASEAKEKAKTAYLDAVKSELLPNEKILEEVMVITPLNKMSLPLSGTAATSFDYQDDFTVKAFIFSEEAIKEKITTQGEEKISGIAFRPVSITLSYGESIPNYDDGTIRLKIHAAIVSESVIERDSLIDEFLGQDESGVSAILEKHPEIKKVQIDFKPQWFSSVVPKSRNRVILFVEPGEEEPS